MIVPTEYRTEEEALRNAASILGISHEDIIKQKPQKIMVEDPYGPPQWLDVYSVPGPIRAGIGFYKYLYDGTVPIIGYGLWVSKNSGVFKQV